MILKWTQYPWLVKVGFVVDSVPMACKCYFCSGLSTLGLQRFFNGGCSTLGLRI